MTGEAGLEGASFRLHTPPGQRFALELPQEWQVHLNPYPDVPLVGVVPQPDPWGFRTNVVITVERLADGTTLEAWQHSADEGLPRTLTDYLLLDRQQTRIGECAAIRRLAHHDSGGRAVTMDQWMLVGAGCGFTLTASTSTLAYPAVADGLALVAATFRVDLTLDQTDTDG